MNLLLPAAWRRIPAKVWIAQVFGNAALILCAVAWLKISDSHVWQLLFSLLLGAALVIGLYWLHTKVIHTLRRAADPVRMPWGALILAAWTLLLYLPSLAAAKIDAGSNQRAGYWNSQLSAHARLTFTYERLSAWQSDLLLALVWYILPAIALPFLVETVARGLAHDSWRRAARCLRRWQHWLAVFASIWLARWATPKLVEWAPGSSVWAEVTSLLLRLALILIVDVVLLTLLYAIECELLARDESPREDAAS